jgi:hypothetical protein
MQVHNFQQGTPEWLKARLGKFTASHASAIATNGDGLRTLCYEKAAEIMTGVLGESYKNADMDRGNELEPTARNMYEMETGNVVTQVGFIESDVWTGCSPDGLVGTDGMVEIKNKKDTLFLRYLMERKIDPAHEWQMQYQMWVAEREWVDYVVYNDNFAKVIITRVHRNEMSVAKCCVGRNAGVQIVKGIFKEVGYEIPDALS